MLRGSRSVIRAGIVQRVAAGAILSVTAAWVIASVSRHPGSAVSVAPADVTDISTTDARKEPRSESPGVNAQPSAEAGSAATPPELVTSAPATPPADPEVAHQESSSLPPAVRSYRVQEGDTLALIAAEAGLRLETLLWANNLDDPALLRPDQEIMIPSVDGALFTLEEGDTLRGLADHTAVPVEEILAANPMPDPDKVPVGTKVLVPGAVPAKASVAAGPGDMRAASSSVTRLSSPKEGPVTYTVQSGDSLVSLEAKFGIDAPTLLAANQLDDPDLISVGIVLRILPVSGVEHVVAPGERLGDIAARYQTVLGLIIDFNGIADPDLVRTGDRLIIPGGRRAVPSGRNATPTEPTSPPSVAAAQPPKPAPVAPPAIPRPVPAARPAPPAVAAPAAGRVGAGIAAIAEQFNGTPYVWGGTSPSGFDCSGLVWYVLKQTGISASRGLWGQYNSGVHISRADLAPGDLVFFQNTYMPGLSHNGIYLGNGQFIHAVDESQGVRVSSIDTSYWTSRWFGATRLS